MMSALHRRLPVCFVDAGGVALSAATAVADAGPRIAAVATAAAAAGLAR